MKGAPGGFTIVEVMIVLGISSAMLVSAITIFSSKRDNTYFTQAVYDLRSELMSIANDVSSQSIPGLQNYRCTPTTFPDGKVRPTLSVNSPTGENCIYLGQAVQLSPNTSNLYSYPVFGLRTIYTGITATDDPPTNPTEAHAEPAIDDTLPSGSIISNLTTTYTMLNGLQVSSAKLNGSDSYILTMYSNLKSNNSSGNEIDVRAAPIVGDAASPNTQIRDCVEENANCPTSTVVNNKPWNLCVSLGPRQALISLLATPSGIVTKLNMNGCS